MYQIVRLLGLLVLLVVVVQCGPPVFVVGGERMEVAKTKVVFANNDPELEYLVFVPGPHEVFSDPGHWVYVLQRAQPAPPEVLGSTLSSLRVRNTHTTAVECPVGWVTFSYYKLRRGRLVGSRADRFTMFIVPAETGMARLIYLSGHNL